MTAAELCRTEPDLLGEHLQLGTRTQCAICGGRMMCKQVITGKRRAADSQPFYVCAGCRRTLARTHQHLVSEDHFLSTVRTLKAFRSITIVDIETSGLLNLQGEIIEIGALKYRLGAQPRVEGMFFQRLKPQTDFFDPQSLAVNGIHPDLLRDAPPPQTVLPRFLEFISDSLIVAHRALFDAGFINLYCDRYGHPRPENPVLDTFVIGQQLYGEPVRLDGLLKRNHIRVPVSRHKSWVDCLTTAEVFFRMARFSSLAELAPRPFASYDPSLYTPVR